MPDGILSAGKLDQLVQVLELQETGKGVWEWVPVRKAWAQVTVQDKRNLFSSVGIGARDAALVLRRQKLTLENALLWGEQHLFLTDIKPRGRGHLVVSAALVFTVKCKAGAIQFPGCLTEKYVQYEAMMPMDVNRVRYVLVTPKAMQLAPGHILDISGTAYHILLAHTLDGYKNEYEIMRTVDL